MFCGETFKDSGGMTMPDRFATVCRIQNQQIEMEAKEKKVTYTDILRDYPFLIYWWKNYPIPLGYPCGRDRFTGDVLAFDAVDQDTLYDALELLPLGLEVMGQNKHPTLAEKFFSRALPGPPSTTLNPEQARILGPSDNIEFVNKLV
jgi:hypothetical protein